jgi:hypothetical protein
MNETLRIFHAFKILFGSHLGQEVLGYLEQEFANRSSFNVDPVQMAFYEGQRHVILTIKHRLKTEPQPQPVQPKGEPVNE